MSTKLTNESVARALGWKKLSGINGFRGKEWLDPHDKTFGAAKPLPAFTTSLDAIVAEVEARGLDWAAGNFERGTPSHQATVGSFKTRIAKVKQEDTAPLALCAALLAYLKETR